MNINYPIFLFTDEFCEEYPHNLIPTPGYWIECSRQKINMPNQLTIWDDSESDHDDEPKFSGSRCGGIASGGGGGGAMASGGGGGGTGGNGSSGGGMGGGSSSDAHLERGCSDLYEDDEDSEAAPR